MHQKGLNPNTKTGKINIKLLEIIKSNPNGVRWVDLQNTVLDHDPTVHPKTLNGCIWKLEGNFPDKVGRNSNGLFVPK